MLELRKLRPAIALAKGRAYLVGTPLFCLDRSSWQVRWLRLCLRRVGLPDVRPEFQRKPLAFLAG